MCALRSFASPLETSTILEDRPVRVWKRVTEGGTGFQNLGVVFRVVRASARIVSSVNSCRCDVSRRVTAEGETKVFDEENDE